MSLDSAISKREENTKAQQDMEMFDDASLAGECALIRVHLFVTSR